MTLTLCVEEELVDEDQPGPEVNKVKGRIRDLDLIQEWVIDVTRTTRSRSRLTTVTAQRRED